MIELHKYEHMQVYRTHSKCTRIYGLVRGGGGGECTNEIKTLRSNLAPEEGGGSLFEGGV